MTHPRISIIIPTYHRPDGLTRAAQSVLADVAGRADVELVIVDNSPEGDALDCAERIRERAPVTVTVIHEPNSGVANARNAGWRAASGDIIAFVDDDESVAPGWLAAFETAYAALGAPVLFGPIEADLPNADAPHADTLKRFFARPGSDIDVMLAEPFGCGNAFIDRAALDLNEPPFDVRTNTSGGEDDRLFNILAARGVRFGWAAKARAFEHVPAARATLSYVLTRSFAFGQGPCQASARRQPAGLRNVIAVARWMAIGAAQTTVYGVVAAALWIVGDARRASYLVKAAAGLGKVFWCSPFEPRLYGPAAARVL